MLISLGERLQVLEKALKLVQGGKVVVESLEDNQLILNLNDVGVEEVEPLMKVIASWIGRTPLARKRKNRIVIYF